MTKASYINDIESRSHAIYNDLVEKVKKGEEDFASFLCKNCHLLLQKPIITNEDRGIIKRSLDGYGYTAPEILNRYVNIVCYQMATIRKEQSHLQVIYEEDDT